VEAASTPDIVDVLTIDQPEQLKALGHPLRLRVLEMLGGTPAEHLTNRELAERLGVDPGHLHFHVRMLLKAGLVALASNGRGREKPYRAVAHSIRVAPELLSSGLTSDVHGAMIDEVQEACRSYSSEGRFRSAQVTVQLPFDRAVELMTEFVEHARDLDDLEQEAIVITTFVHPGGRLGI
jgi:DNA-binding transcriptional ArsR family regulator